MGKKDMMETLFGFLLSMIVYFIVFLVLSGPMSALFPNYSFGAIVGFLIIPSAVISFLLNRRLAKWL